MEIISICIPCYNEEKSLPIFYNEIIRIAKLMNEVEFEFVFVDDGSSDNTLDIIKDLANSDNRVRFISFSRNFGKEAALYAGIKYSKGDYVAVMDADMQDPPALLPNMLKSIKEEGYDCAATRRNSRNGEPVIRSFFARMFYRIVKKISKAEIIDGARDFRLMTRQMVNAVLSMGEYNRFSKGIFGWVGFKTKWFEFENIERVAGETKWSFWKLFIYSIEGIVAFSTVPLALSSLIGLFFCFASFVLILVIISKTLLWGDPVTGWPSLASIVFFVGGIQLFCTGIIGNYLANIYLETKGRPIYIVKQEG
ncbi:glycosyltransferase [Paenibacillus odorifer]|uniref:Glycosyltransferase n=1 Tax=Paenibacillus odorifer TaxID=189426 RepID=A0A1R0WY18_9BACL|nr:MULTISPECIES: glycosyltransferase family 2 protein [Paenibacillus]ETT65591.1 glycosyl transferase family protein [Paenibacillus sp. FSL H8-237]OMD24072.1 glycosyltransferase [Paenibacillus odorifer]OMD74700.1 glycosyltransferase [Paenibacillus odorifer]OME56565.1 glycosyltransferase [Paenibacillus odorifer]OME59129.1 glycosyltransferase [Paenibacillus odorifer]